MNNQEKAIDICRGYNYRGILTPQGVAGFAVDRCKEMAEWKDHQFKEYLEKKRDSITNYAQSRMYAHIYNEIINELLENNYDKQNNYKHI